MNRLPLLLIALLVLGLGPALADTYTILVAPRDTPAQTFAASKADDVSVFAERTLHLALTRAAELLQAGPHTVNVLVAQGAYVGKAKTGVWVVPTVDNPEGVLRLLGGYNDDFSGRQPFALLSELQTIYGRDGALLQFSQRSVLREVVVSGFYFDAAPSNKYDTRTNSILKGQSRSYPLISFSLLKTDHLVVADNIFLNGAHGAFDPYVQPLSAGAVVDIQNNVFLNNIKALKLGAPKPVQTLNLRHNTFFLNWPYNPDNTSSNVSAVELYHSDGAKQVNIEGNLFAYNPGGAMQHDWPEDRMPDLALRDNLFHSNAALFEEGAADAGVFAGKFGTNPRYMVLDLITVEDDFGYDVEGNVALDPEIPIALADLETADSYGAQRQNTTLNDVRRIFGLNQDGGTVAIANYAPAIVYHFPIPANEAAKAYGVQPDRLWGM